MTPRLKALWLALFIALSTCGNVAADWFPPPDHDWLLDCGLNGVGLQGYDGKSPRTYIGYGFDGLYVPYSIYTVAGVGGAIILSIMGLGVYAMMRLKSRSQSSVKGLTSGGAPL